MRVELLRFAGCPSAAAAEERLRRALAGAGIGAEIERISVETDEQARGLRFPGSPTIRVDGGDLFPGAEGGEGGLRCRVYATPGGMAGAPTEGMITRALRETAGRGSDE